MSKSQSNAYDLCSNCKHFRHKHSDTGKCYADTSCGCKGFKEVNDVSIEQQVIDYQAYLKIISDKIESEIPHVRSIDKDYAEEVARNIVNVLDSQGWCIRRKV